MMVYHSLIALFVDYYMYTPNFTLKYDMLRFLRRLKYNVDPLAVVVYNVLLYMY